MYSRGYPPQSPRFSPNRRGSGGHHHYNPYNNNSASNLTNCGFQQRQNYRTPSPRGSQQYTSPSPQFQIPRSPMQAMFLGPAVPSPSYGGGGHVPRGGYPQGPPGLSSYSAQRSPRHFSPRQKIFPYSSSPRGRGNFSHGKTSTPKFRGGRQGRGNNKVHAKLKL